MIQEASLTMTLTQASCIAVDDTSWAVGFHDGAILKREFYGGVVSNWSLGHPIVHIAHGDRDWWAATPHHIHHLIEGPADGAGRLGRGVQPFRSLDVTIRRLSVFSNPDWPGWESLVVMGVDGTLGAHYWKGLGFMLGVHLDGEQHREEAIRNLFTKPLIRLYMITKIGVVVALTCQGLVVLDAVNQATRTLDVSPLVDPAWVMDMDGSQLAIAGPPLSRTGRIQILKGTAGADIPVAPGEPDGFPATILQLLLTGRTRADASSVVDLAGVAVPALPPLGLPSASGGGPRTAPDRYRRVWDLIFQDDRWLRRVAGRGQIPFLVGKQLEALSAGRIHPAGGVLYLGLSNAIGVNRDWQDIADFDTSLQDTHHQKGALTYWPGGISFKSGLHLGILRGYAPDNHEKLWTQTRGRVTTKLLPWCNLISGVPRIVSVPVVKGTYDWEYSGCGYTKLRLDQYRFTVDLCAIGSSDRTVFIVRQSFEKPRPDQILENIPDGGWPTP